MKKTIKPKRFRRKPLKSGDIEIKIRFQDDFMTVITHNGDILEAQQASPLHWNKLYHCIMGIMSNSVADDGALKMAMQCDIEFLPIMQMLSNHGFDIDDDGSVHYPRNADRMYHVIFERRDDKLFASRPFRFSYDYPVPVLKRRTNINDPMYYNEYAKINKTEIDVQKSILGKP